MSANYHIEFLCRMPKYVEVAAVWVLADRSNFYPLETIEDARRRVQASLFQGQIPFALVAHDGVEPVGVVSVLAQNAPPGYERLSPWLSSLYVSPRKRGQGLEEALLNRAVSEVKALGNSELYTWTSGDKEWYQQLGWQVAGTTIFGRRYVGVLRLDLSA